MGDNRVIQILSPECEDRQAVCWKMPYWDVVEACQLVAFGVHVNGYFWKSQEERIIAAIDQILRFAVIGIQQNRIKNPDTRANIVDFFEDMGYSVDHLRKTKNNGMTLSATVTIGKPEPIDDALLPDGFIRMEFEKAAAKYGLARAINAVHLDHTADQLTPTTPATTTVKTIRGIDKQQAVIAFGELCNTCRKKVNLKKAIENRTKWLQPAIVSVGKKGMRGRNPTILNPVMLADILCDSRDIPRFHLHRVFQEHDFLADWWDEWKELYKSL